MRDALKYVVSVLLGTLGLAAQAQIVRVDTASFPRPDWIHVDGEFLNQLQPRDSILIGDHLEYGFVLEGVDVEDEYNCLRLLDPDLEVISEWKQDTLRIVDRKAGTRRFLDIRMSFTMAPFEEGTYAPIILLERKTREGASDTLYFDPIKFDVKTVQLDSAFVMHDIRPQIHTPFNWDEFVYTVKEVWMAFVRLLPTLEKVKWGIVLLIFIVYLLIFRSRKTGREDKVVENTDPAHVVALRKLDTFRSNAMWVPEKQKLFYTGVTDAVREYISRRYGISAQEMTTAELFKSMDDLQLSKDQLQELRDLFERADFVKFAKFVASDEDNASAVPVAVRFVTSTYQEDLMVHNVTEEVEDQKK